MGMEIDGKVRKNIINILEKTSQLQIKIAHKNNERFVWVNWFEFIEFDEKIKKIKLRFTQTIFEVIKVIGHKFTKLDFSVIGKCSFYAIRWYMFVKELMYLKGKGENSKNTWTVVKSLEEIKKVMNIDESTYQDRTNNFLKNVIRNPIEELNKINTEFQIGTPDKLFSKIKKGKSTVGIMLECTYLKNTCKITKFDSYEQKQDKIAINNEEDFIAKYRKEFDSFFEQEKINPSVAISPALDNDLFRKARALSALAKKHPIVARRFGVFSKIQEK